MAMITNNFVRRKAALVQLGSSMKSLIDHEDWPGYEIGVEEEIFSAFHQSLKLASVKNPWFTSQMINHALTVWAQQLREENINQWLNKYNDLDKLSSKTVLIICAGNLPLVGWHDFICCYLLGAKVQLKLSKSDDVLIPELIKILTLFDADVENNIQVLEQKPMNYDLVIATGSNNTNRYFDYYFGKYPHIFRKNRTSIAVIDDHTSTNDLEKLANDVFGYFGLGCRSVTKLYIKKGFEIDKIFNAFFAYKEIMNHVKYMNNYDYNKSIYLLEEIPFLDNGFVMLKEDVQLHSPVSVINYEYYEHLEELNEKLTIIDNEIQCRVGLNGIPFGSAQNPSLSDYADGIDTIQFLIDNLN